MKSSILTLSISFLVFIFFIISNSYQFDKDSVLLSYLRYRVVPGPFFSEISLKRNLVLKLSLVNESDKALSLNPEAELVSLFHRTGNFEYIVYGRLLQFSKSRFYIENQVNCDSNSVARKTLDDLLRLLLKFHFIKSGDSLRLTMVKYEMLNFQPINKDTCVINVLAP